MAYKLNRTIKKMNNLYNIKVGDTLESVIDKLNTPTSISKINDNLKHLLYIWQTKDKTINVVILDKQVLSVEYYERYK